MPGIAAKLQTCQRLLAPAAGKCWYSGMRHRLQPTPGPPARTPPPPRHRARPGPAPVAVGRGGAWPGGGREGSCSPPRAHACARCGGTVCTPPGSVPTSVCIWSCTCPRRVPTSPNIGAFAPPRPSLGSIPPQFTRCPTASVGTSPEPPSLAGVRGEGDMAVGDARGVRRGPRVPVGHSQHWGGCTDVLGGGRARGGVGGPQKKRPGAWGQPGLC